MKTYERYKPSGVEWIGDIPEHWEVKKLKYVGESIIGITYSPDDVLADESGTLVLRSSNIQNGVLAFEDCVYVAKEIQSKHLTKPGDILICARNGSAHLVGKSALIDEKSSGLTFGAFMSVFRSQSGRFLYYFFSSEIFKSQTGLFSTSTINQLTSDTLNNLLIGFPSDEDEQTAIANYLDEKTAQLDKLIEGKRRLIALLKEERSAVINNAVTRGINPHAKLKPSGIDWLGEIPEDWEVKKLKYLTDEKLKYGANESAEQENYEHPRYIRITDFGEDGKLREESFKSLPPEIAADYLLQNGDILFARSGATVGKTFQFKDYEGLACFAGYLIKASPNETKVLSDFLYLFTKSGVYEGWKNSIFIQATIQNIGADKYSSLEVPLPPLEEQKQIVQFIETETGKIDATVAKIEKEIEYLLEYRTALISEVVTGKIKVSEPPAVAGGSLA